MFSTIWKKSVLIKDIRPNRFYLIADLEYLSRTMITYESNLKSREDDIEKDMEEHQKIVDEIMTIPGIEPIEAEIEEVWHCPDGYIFKDENGNIINATKIVLEKKKKEYPKTFEEFKELVKRMREAQRNYYKDRPKAGYKVAYQNMINKEQLVDKFLQEQAGSSREE